MFIAENFVQFRELFVSQLKKMLSPDELGAFILVLANSRQDAFLKNTLDFELNEIFSSFKHDFETRINSGKLRASQDDVDVFKQLLDVDLNEITCWKSRCSGGWEIVYNTMRKLRPARASNEVLTSIFKNFDDTKFHFNKPFLKPEILWQGNCHFNNKNVRVLYNKFPFSNYHLLLSVSPEKNYPQFLTQEMHEFVVSMVNEVETIFPGFGVGFNSLAAGASVNHLHFQGFIRNEIFPIENLCWRHNGGDEEYPLVVKHSSDVWPYIENLTEQNIAFNCVYRKGVCYVVPRQHQGVVKLPEWLHGAGWLDVAGVLTVSDEITFNLLDGGDITEALGKLSN